MRAKLGVKLGVKSCVLAGLFAGMALAASAPAAGAAPPDAIRVELNATADVQNRCRLSFVIENKGAAAVESLKLDLVVFGRDGVIDRRLITDMGPLRGAKTIVKSFDIDGECGKLGSILVNGVTACAPDDAGACLDRLELTSRLPDVRLFK